YPRPATFQSEMRRVGQLKLPGIGRLRARQERQLPGCQVASRTRPHETEQSRYCDCGPSYGGAASGLILQPLDALDLLRGAGLNSELRNCFLPRRLEQIKHTRRKCRIGRALGCLWLASNQALWGRGQLQPLYLRVGRKAALIAVYGGKRLNSISGPEARTKTGAHFLRAGP